MAERGVVLHKSIVIQASPAGRPWMKSDLYVQISVAQSPYHSFKNSNVTQWVSWVTLATPSWQNLPPLTLPAPCRPLSPPPWFSNPRSLAVSFPVRKLLPPFYIMLSWFGAIRWGIDLVVQQGWLVHVFHSPKYLSSTVRVRGEQELCTWLLHRCNSCCSGRRQTIGVIIANCGELH